MKLFFFALLAALFIAGCKREKPAATPGVPPATTPATGPVTAAERAGAELAAQPAVVAARRRQETPYDQQRKEFQTRLLRREAANEPPPEPPGELFRLVRYDAPLGKLAAYVSVPPDPAKKHPAIVWCTGGFSNGIGDTAWQEGPPENDQSAGAFRKAGIVMMFPSFRGGNDNPGYREMFLGEVDDLLAAAEYLAKQEFVDPQRLYLGGHSTGGTLAILGAAGSDKFRAVFSFGPAHDVNDYGAEWIPFDYSNLEECFIRGAWQFVDELKSPTFVFEGTERPGNLKKLEELRESSRKSPVVRFHPVKGANHFSILAPVTRLVAQKILKDQGPATNISFTEQELNALFGK